MKSLKDHLGLGQKNQVPPLMVRTSYVVTVSDPGLGAVNGSDGLPDVALGRLSAGSVEEAQELVAKVLAFEDGGFGIGGRAVLVADNADQAGNFEANTDEIASSLLAGREVERIYLRRCSKRRIGGRSGHSAPAGSPSIPPPTSTTRR